MDDDLTPQTSLEIVSRNSVVPVPIRSRSEPDYEAQNDSDSAIMLEDNSFTEVRSVISSTEYILLMSRQASLSAEVFSLKLKMGAKS